MRTTYIHILWLCLFSILGISAVAQTNTCGPEEIPDPDGYEGTVSFNYGSCIRARSNTFKTAYAVGQNFVGQAESLERNTTYGFYSRYLLPPFGLKVKASQGELLDRILVTWEVDELGPGVTEGFVIERNGQYHDEVKSDVRSYSDFEVIAGQPYTYSVRGRNLFGLGNPGEAIGFQVPNGVVTGWVSTRNGSAVPGASILLEPMQGFAAKFEGGAGAFAPADTAHPFLPAMGEDWTLTFWVKTDTGAVTGTAGKLIGFDSLYIRSRPNFTGIAIASTAGGAAFLADNFPDTKYGWHHVALSFDGNGNRYRLYFDGKFRASAIMNPVASPDALKFGTRAGPGFWNGRIDEVRIYHHQLDELDFNYVMEATASSSTAYLSHYWKMDEELGERSYDILNRQPLYFCNAVFDPDRPPVHTAGITDEEGYYRIESASYGTGTSFIATPSKNFYLHRSLKFERAETDSVRLPNFPITRKATIEMWLNSAGVDGNQCLLTKQWGTNNEIRFMLIPNGNDYDVRVILNEVSRNFGLLGGSGYKHLAFVWDSTARSMRLYKDGLPLGNIVTWAQGIVNTGNWSDPNKPWLMGMRYNGADAFGGLIDEIAFYDSTLSQMTIQNHKASSRSIQEQGLRIYFPFDEGNGNLLSNVGSLLLPGGLTVGTEWSPLAVHQVVEPHVFSPKSKQVTLNPSVTSVDQVYFTDESSIPVSGYVRYKDSDCFAKNVEILVNGLPYSPRIFTDSTGHFLIDFEPGASGILTPVFDDHQFSPAEWEVTNASSPIAGILFNDLTTHDITGKVAGGLCELSIISLPSLPQGTKCKVKVSSMDGCFERELQVMDSINGTFAFNDLPPLDQFQVAVIEHSNDEIKTAFDVQGGYIVDISRGDGVANFIYFAIPEVRILSGPESISDCELVMEQGVPNEMEIQLVEVYEGVDCPIDSAYFRIINEFSDETTDTLMSEGTLLFEFTTGDPNPTPPYKKSMQIIGTTLDGNETEYLITGYVTGFRNYLNTFATTLPETPFLVLHDPPGDGSYAFLEKNEKVCQQISFSKEVTEESGLTGILDVGPDNEIPIFFGAIEFDLESNIGTELTGTTTITKAEESAIEVCTSFDERISTSEDDLIVGGQGGDVFVGGALNIEFGFIAELTWDEDSCKVDLGSNVSISPGNWATTFMYTDWHIRNTVMVYLDSLARETEGQDPELHAIFSDSYDNWEEILADNEARKSAANYERNISFSSGLTYEYSETSDSSMTTSTVSSTSYEMGSDINFQVFVWGIGGGVIIHANHEDVRGDGAGTANEKGITTGYVLSDDDVLDAFSVDIGIDSVYKTPIFNLKAGQSSCPWEAPTAKREGVLLTSTNGLLRTDVPANEAAAFTFTLGNVSSTQETWTYAFTAGPESNPHGAKVFCNGAPMNQIQWYAIPWGTSLEVTVTVERGPIEYDYDSLEIVLYSACEDQRANDLGILPDTALYLYSAEYISVHFIRPCSEVNITVPQQDWVIFPDPNTGPNVDDNLMRITVSGYDTIVSNFRHIQLQYRESNGDGAWINLPDSSRRFNPNYFGLDTVPGLKPKLGKLFTQFYWQTGLLQDGLYEIRAVAVCMGDEIGKPGFSQVIKGRIDRQAPKLLGYPEPADGVLHHGDEISATFDQPINCADMIQFAANRVKLFNDETGGVITREVTCLNNKIVIRPTFDNALLENRRLRAELHNVDDLVGNRLTLTQWEFYVDRNEIAWLTDSAGITKFEDETKSINVKIHNRAGFPVPFSIEDVPDWLHVSPDAGELVANQELEIQLTAPDSMELGSFTESIILHTENIPGNANFIGGDEPLDVGVRNLCRAPDWEVDPTPYQLTMTMSLRIQINGGNASTDPEDQVAVFIDGQLRGSGHLEQIPNGTWVAFVTVYGNTSDNNKAMTYEVFDADACLHYAGTLTGAVVNFSSNTVIGTPNAPRTIITSNSLLLHDIQIAKGWNWLSFNLAFADPAINKALSKISNPGGDLIKSSDQFATNSNGLWVGSLATLNNTSAYFYDARQANTLKITGAPLNPAITPIPVSANWTWIGYIPTYPLPVNTALGSLTPTAGDIIKGQTSFAQYLNATAGWVGNLKTMKPHEGYLLKLTNAGTITYPPQPLGGEQPVTTRGAESVMSYWNVDASQYEHNMTLIGYFEFDGLNATTGDMELGAFVGGEVRGSGEAIYIEELNAHLFFLTSFANTSGEQVHFKLYDRTTGEIQNLAEKMFFIPNHNQGSIISPTPFHLPSTGVDELSHALSFDVRPNPFNDETVCQFVLPTTQHVRFSISDVNGKMVYFTQFTADAGSNKIVWKGCSNSGTPLSNGVYLLQLQTDQGIVTQKVVLQR